MVSTHGSTLSMVSLDFRRFNTFDGFTQGFNSFDGFTHRFNTFREHALGKMTM
jgi:hypothetical protein